jgi:hypothetical protein
VVLGHALTKAGSVPEADIQRALARKAMLQKDPLSHIYED